MLSALSLQVGKMTLTGLLQCSYTVAASFARESTVLEEPGGRAKVSLDTLKLDDTWQNQNYVQVKGHDREVQWASERQTGTCYQRGYSLQRTCQHCQ